MQKDIYHIFGKFVIEFEMSSSSLEHCVRSLLGKEGLSNEGAIDCILAGMTAEPLSSLVQSLCYECLELSEDDIKVLDSIFNRFRKLISKRNDIVHGQHFISIEGKWSQTSDYGDKSISFKLHRNKKGSSRKVTELTCDTMLSLYQEAEISLRNLCKLSACIDKSYPIAPNFCNKEDGQYIALFESELIK